MFGSYALCDGPLVRTTPPLCKGAPHGISEVPFDALLPTPPYRGRNFLWFGHCLLSELQCILCLGLYDTLLLFFRYRFARFYLSGGSFSCMHMVHNANHLCCHVYEVVVCSKSIQVRDNHEE